jgi:hypothetical protein
VWTPVNRAPSCKAMLAGRRVVHGGSVAVRGMGRRPRRPLLALSPSPEAALAPGATAPWVSVGLCIPCARFFSEVRRAGWVLSEVCSEPLALRPCSAFSWAYPGNVVVRLKAGSSVTMRNASVLLLLFPSSRPFYPPSPVLGHPLPSECVGAGCLWPLCLRLGALQPSPTSPTLMTW